MASVCLSIEVAFALIFALVQWYPTTPGMQAISIHCLDRNEVFFEFDYFIKGGYNRSAKDGWCQIGNILEKYSCFSALFLAFVVESNLLEIFLTGRILFEMKKSTKNSASMLSKKALHARKR